MRALVLCGGIPQAALIEELKSRGIYTILADMNPHVMARPLADEFYPVSVLDVDAVRKLAEEQKVDMVLTACADQAPLLHCLPLCKPPGAVSRNLPSDRYRHQRYVPWKGWNAP